MSTLRLLKTSFTAGEVAPPLLGRSDLAAYDNGAAKLRNVFVHATGGISRRAGLRHIERARKVLERYAPVSAIAAPNGGTGANANDDDSGTKLTTTTGLGTAANYVVLQYDLGSAQPVLFADVLELSLSAGAVGDEFRIQHSPDAATWTNFGGALAVDGVAASARRAAAGGAPVSARYWRLVRNGPTDLGSAIVSLGGFHLWREGAAASAGRLVAFAFNTEQTYLFCVTDRSIAVFAGDALVAQLPSPYGANAIPAPATPYDAGAVGQFAWAQSADTLLLAHPHFPPLRVLRRLVTQGGQPVEDWITAPWRFIEEETKDASGTLIGKARRQPYHKFADPDLTLTPSGTTRDTTITVTASAPAFDPLDVGQRFRIEQREIEITAVTSSVSATALVKETLKSTNAAKDWEEPAFSARRGWSASCGFHQDRLVIGGTRDLPNRLWLSKSADLFNFDLGEGRDDEAIEFAILSDQVNAIRAVLSGRHLQVFTSGAEFMVTGDPLTPANVQLKRQTRIGSPVGRYVPPRDVDGATLFVARSGRELREFLFADVEQAYQSNDLAVLAHHLMTGAIDQDYDARRRLFHVVMQDGSLATVTIYRAEQVTAWSVQATDGKFRAVATLEDDVFALVERAGAVFIERFDESLSTDAALAGESEAPLDEWAGLDHLEGRTVAVVADDTPLPPHQVSGGAITLETPATKVEVGLPFAMEVEPLPPAALQPRLSNQGIPVRLVSANFRLLAARALRVDTGRGVRDIPFKRLGAAGVLDTGPASFTGDVTVRALGWRRGTAPLWRIAQDTPLPCTILAVSTLIAAGDASSGAD
ncbi:MAG TPA: hypothetical protein VIF14_14310 [Alphaproteobacteria bacterium]|jgi:hypothetical protein